MSPNGQMTPTGMTKMKKTSAVATASLLLLSLSGCASVGNVYQELYDWDIRGNQASDQPITSRAAPLMVPPDYPLMPAQTGTVRTQEGSTQEQTLEAMFGGPAQRSTAETAITRSASSADPGIRSTVGDPETLTVNKGSVTRDVIAAPEGDGQNAQAAVPE